MSSGESKPFSWFARLWPKRLTLGFGIVVCTAVLITEVIFLIPAAYFWHKDNQAQAIETVRQAWYHSSNPSAFLSAEEKSRVGERMVRDGLLLGGVVFDSAGEPLAVFGERPVLDLNIARLSGVNAQPSPTTPAIDLHLPPAETQMSNHLIVRLPTGPIDEATYVQLRNFGLSVLFIAGLTAALFIAASMLMVIRPMRAINDALRKAIEDPYSADQYRLSSNRGDEIGQISRSLNMLLTSVSVVFQDELASLKHANEEFGFGILQYDNEDRLVAANPAALAMLEHNDLEGLKSMNRNCAQPLGAKRAVPQPLVDLLGETKDPMLVTLHMGAEEFTAMAFCSTVRRSDGAITSRSVALIAMDDVLSDARQAISGQQKARKELQSALIEKRELRRLLESCLCLLEEPASSEEEQVKFLPDRVLNDWYQEAQRDDMVSGTLEHGVLHPLMGHPQVVRNVLRQAMLLAYSQTQADKPALKVVSTYDTSNQVEFTITDVSDARGDVGKKRRTKGVDPTLPLAALQSALQSCGGSYKGLRQEDGSIAVRFTLLAAGRSAQIPTSTAA